MKVTILIIALLGISFAYGKECPDNISPLIPKLPDNTNMNDEVHVYLNSLHALALFGNANVEGSYSYLHSWYGGEMRTWRRSSRMLSLLIIILGASIPLVAVLCKKDDNRKNNVVACIGVAIVISQGFVQTFKFDKAWRGFTYAKLELESAHHTWQNEVVVASMMTEGGLERAQKATDEFSNMVSNIVIKESAGYFELSKQQTK